MQVTLARGTAPFVVDGVNVQETVSTMVPTGCSTVITALVNDRSVIFSVQFVLGQSGAPGMMVTGGTVVTSKGVFPFLSSLSGIA